MGVFDQSARYATQVEPEAVIARLLRATGETRRFAREFDTRSVPLPGGPDRTADLAVVLEPGPVLLALEFQTEHDPEKLDTTLLEAALYRCYAHHGPERAGKFTVLTALIYLKGRCPESVVRMQIGGFGTLHSCLVWDVAADDAAAALDEVGDGRATWGLLFWVPLMSGGGEGTVIERWKALVTERVADPVMRGNVRSIAEKFAEVAGCLPAWSRGLEGWDVTESQVVNRWQLAGRVATRREDLLLALDRRFPGAISVDVRAAIQANESMELLQEWFQAAIDAKSAEEFLAVLRR